MKSLIRLEEVGMFFLGLFLYHLTEASWWWFFGLLLAPDIGMLGYLISNKIGAFTYSLFHHKGLAVLLYIGGVSLLIEELEIAGIILFTHASLDRIFGYGLKYTSGFKDTHLGTLS